MKKVLLSISLFLFATGMLVGQTVIAYWDQNSNGLATAGQFGFTTDDFPQAADQGTGFLALGNFNASFTTNVVTQEDIYDTIQSFGGTTVNALGGVVSGGSLSPQGGAELVPGEGMSNNGMYIDLIVSTAGFDSITVSWAQRGTSTGFNSRAFSYSVDGGSNFTLHATDTGALGSTFVVESYDLSAITALNENPNVVFRITLDGASGATGNNRFDNILVTGNSTTSPILVPVLTPSIAGGDVEVSFPTQADVYYRLQSSTGLSGFANVAGQALVGTGAVESFNEAAPAVGEKAFYLLDVGPVPASLPPEVTALSTVFADVTTTFTVIGDNLKTASAVTINGTSASFSLNGNFLDVSVPLAATTGYLEVTNPDGTDLTANPIVITNTAALVYQQEFTAGPDDFTIVDVLGSVTWAAGSYDDADYMEGNGFASDGPSEDWLISPEIDLSDIEGAFMHLGHERDFTGNPLVVQVSTNYPGGDPNAVGVIWTPLTITLDTSGNITDTGVTDLSAFDGQAIHVAFKYTAVAPGPGGGARDRIHYFAVGGNPVAPF